MSSSFSPHTQHRPLPTLHYTRLHISLLLLCPIRRCGRLSLLLLLFCFVAFRLLLVNNFETRSRSLSLAHTFLRSRSHSRIQCRMTAKNVFRIFSFSCLISLLCFYFSFDIYTHTHTHAHRSMGRDKLLHLA